MMKHSNHDYIKAIATVESKWKFKWKSSNYIKDKYLYGGPK